MDVDTPFWSSRSWCLFLSHICRGLFGGSHSRDFLQLGGLHGRRLVLYVHTRAVEWAPWRWWPMLRFWDQPKNEVIADHCNDETYHVMLWPIMWWRDQWFNVESNHAILRSILWWILRPIKDDDSNQVIETCHINVKPTIWWWDQSVVWWWDQAYDVDTNHVMMKQIMSLWDQSCDREANYGMMLSIMLCWGQLYDVDANHLLMFLIIIWLEQPCYSGQVMWGWGYSCNVETNFVRMRPITHWGGICHCSVSRWRPHKVDKRMVLEYTHGLFIT
jgi:hypothetical protein